MEWILEHITYTTKRRVKGMKDYSNRICLFWKMNVFLCYNFHSPYCVCIYVNLCTVSFRANEAFNRDKNLLKSFHSLLPYPPPFPSFYFIFFLVMMREKCEKNVHFPCNLRRFCCCAAFHYLLFHLFFFCFTRWLRLMLLSKHNLAP